MALAIACNPVARRDHNWVHTRLLMWNMKPRGELEMGRRTRWGGQTAETAPHGVVKVLGQSRHVESQNWLNACIGF